ncbi:MAG: class I SAM-dependent methyltransferase [Steroidobacteraceae bacterium]
MLERARRTAAEERLQNFLIACGDATALPFASGSLDILVCSFALHHIAHPETLMRETARALRDGGRLGLMDLIVSEDATRAEENNRIERTRDHSHTRTLRAAEIADMCTARGLRVRAQETLERRRDFDDWMHVAGWKPGDATYEQTRRLMENSMAGDSAGFHPRWREASGGVKTERALEYFQTTLLLAAVKE